MKAKRVENPYSGVPGVRWHTRYKAWEVEVNINGQTLFGGKFTPKDSTPEEVERARLLAVESRRKLECQNSEIEKTNIPFRDRKNARGVELSRFGVEKTPEGSSILKLSELSRFGVEKAREGSSILKISRSGVEKTRERSNYPVSVPITREGSSILKIFRSEVEKNARGVKLSRSRD